MKICPPRQKGHAFCDQKDPPKPWTLKLIFGQKITIFYHFGEMSIRFKLWVRFLKIFKILRNQTSSFLILVYSHVFETLYTIILPKSCVAHLKFQLQYFVHHFHCLKIGIRYIRHSHSSMCTWQHLNEALAMKIIALWYMWHEHWIVAACKSLRRTNQF